MKTISTPVCKAIFTAFIFISSATATKANYFSHNVQFASTPGNAVKYVSFNGLANAKKVVVLDWSTEMEANTNHYEVERSFDMNNFTTIGLVLDALTVNESSKGYKFKDNSPELQEKSIAYYRLKQIGNDDKATYSAAIAVRLQSPKDISMQVSPNPFAEKLHIRFDASEVGNAEIRIINVAGQTIVYKQSIINKGYNNLQVEGLKSLIKGTYIAEVSVNGVSIAQQKIIKD